MRNFESFCTPSVVSMDNMFNGSGEGAGGGSVSEEGAGGGSVSEEGAGGGNISSNENEGKLDNKDPGSAEWDDVYKNIMSESVEADDNTHLEDAFNQQKNSNVQQGMANFQQTQTPAPAQVDGAAQLEQMIKSAVASAIKPIQQQNLRMSISNQVQEASLEHSKELLMKYQDAIRKKMQIVSGLTVAEAARLVIPAKEYRIQGKKEAAELFKKQFEGLQSDRGGSPGSFSRASNVEKIEVKGKGFKDVLMEGFDKSLDKMRITGG